MNIVEALKSHSNDIRITNGNKWMIWDDDSGRNGEWRVYVKERGKSQGTLLESTESEELAIHLLLSE